MKIALLAYGSIVLNAHSPIYDAKVKICTPFEEISCKLPLSFSRLSSFGTIHERVTLVPDKKKGIKTPLYAAEMCQRNFKGAVGELKLREGTTKDKFIAYIQKNFSSSEGMSTCKVIYLKGSIWYYRVKNIKRKYVKKIVKFLVKNNYDCAILTNFENNYRVKKIKKRISQNKLIADNTKAYYDSLPHAVQRVHSRGLESLGIDLKLH